MWEFASIVERARRAAAAVSQLEEALANNPESISTQVSLAASKKMALKSHDDLLSVAKYRHVDICDYRLIPTFAKGYKVSYVSRSILGYQYLFSQVYDSIKNGVKSKTVLGKDSEENSALEIAYTYSGSLGMMLYAHNERDLFASGELDGAITSLNNEVLEIKSRSEVREVASRYGAAVIKRLHDWSRTNVDGGYSTGLRWTRSDGREVGRVCDVRELGVIVDMIVATSDEKTVVNNYIGILIGGDLKSRIFHFVVPNGPDLRGTLGREFPEYIEMRLGKRYKAVIREISTTVYATEREDIRRELINLIDPEDAAVLPLSS
jgi:hypothetical protein